MNMHVLGVNIKEPKDAQEIFEMIEDYREKNEVFIQIFDHSKVVGEEHLLWAFNKAEDTFEQGNNRANDLEIETLLWSSGEWQIKEAIAKMGLDDKAENAALLIGEEPSGFLNFMDWGRDDSLLEAGREKLKAFGIKEEEIESVEKPEDLFFEKMSTSIL